MKKNLTLLTGIAAGVIVGAGVAQAQDVFAEETTAPITEGLNEENTTPVEEVTETDKEEVTEAVEEETTPAAETDNEEEITAQSDEVSSTVAKIGEATYDTFADAYSAAAENDVIELIDNGIIVQQISKSITVNGNGKILSIDATAKNKNETADIEIRGATVTFNNTILDFTSSGTKNWTLYMNGTATLNLNNSTMTVDGNNVKPGLYTSPGATINVNTSTLTFQNTKGNAWMQGDQGWTYAYLIIKDSTVLFNNIQGSGNGNGLNWVSTVVDNSTLTFNDNDRQCIVGGRLEVKNNSTVNMINSGIGFTMYGRDYFNVDGTSSVYMINLAENALWMWGGTVDFASGSTVEMTGIGYDLDSYEYYDAIDCSVIFNDNYYALYYPSYGYETSAVIFEDGANVSIHDNYDRAIYNNGDAYIGNTSSIVRNGLENEYTQLPIYGGGIYNDSYGSLTVAAGAELYNNHATNAADDLYNWYGYVELESVGSDWYLDGNFNECTHKITGWFDDSEGFEEVDAVSLDDEDIEDSDEEIYARWLADTSDKDARHVVEVEAGTYDGDLLQLKAAHGVLTYNVIVNYVDEDGNVIGQQVIVKDIDSFEGYDVSEYNQIEIDGYTYDRTEGNVISGTPTEQVTEDQIVNVIYKKNESKSKASRKEAVSTGVETEFVMFAGSASVAALGAVELSLKKRKELKRVNKNRH